MGRRAHDNRSKVGVIVAYPGAETLWAGGTLLQRDDWDLFILAASPGPAPRLAGGFPLALAEFGAQGSVADLREASPGALLAQLPRHDFDVLISHAGVGEGPPGSGQARVAACVRALHDQGRLRASEFWQFAYEEEGGMPRAARDATLRRTLPLPCWQAKKRILTDFYGYPDNAWEALATPPVEGFRMVHPDPGWGTFDDWGHPSFMHPEPTPGRGRTE